ncbi:MAG TPA: hypothetical protein VGC42_10925, partial [Kofleriaceae bacterium]
MLTWSATLGLGLVTTACSSDDNKATPTAAEYDDTAQAIAAATAPSNNGAASGGDTASMSATVSISLGITPPSISLMGNGHYHGSFLGLDYDYALTCYTAGATAPCGPTTDSAAADVTWSGNLSSAVVQASVDRGGNWMVSGLQTDTATFSGSSTFSFDMTLHSIFRPGVTSTYNFDASASYDDVRIATDDGAVTGGSASFSVTAHHMTDGTNADVNS